MAEKNQPLVNILTPVYNGEQFLAECIQSVREQDYDNWEYVIIDNASTDGTAEILERYAGQDERIRVIRNSTTVGALENHNIAVRAANPLSEYCKIQHADDVLLPGCIRKMVEVGERYPSSGLIGSLSLWGETLVCDGLPQGKEFFSGQEVASAVLLQQANPFWSPSCLMHRTQAALQRDLFYNEDNLHADIQSDYEILRDWDFAFVHEPLTYIRSHADSRTSTLANPLRKTLATNLEMLLDYGPEFLSTSDFNAQVDRQLAHYYKKLAISFFELRGMAFWGFHKQALSAMNKPLSNLRLTKCIAQEFKSAPLKCTKKLLRFALRRPISL